VFFRGAAYFLGSACKALLPGTLAIFPFEGSQNVVRDSAPARVGVGKNGIDAECLTTFWECPLSIGAACCTGRAGRRGFSHGGLGGHGEGRLTTGSRGDTGNTGSFALPEGTGSAACPPLAGSFALPGGLGQAVDRSWAGGERGGGWFLRCLPSFCMGLDVPKT